MFMKYLLGSLIALIGIVGGLLGFEHVASPQLFGGFSPSGGSTYRLGQSIGTSDTTIKLSSFKEPVSNILYTMSYLGSTVEYGTLSPQSSISEFVSFSGITQNADGSATLTGVSRGLTRTPAGSSCTASTTLAQPHAGQSIFILSDSPCLFSEYATKQNAQTISGLFTFTTLPETTITPTNGNQLVNYSTLLATAISGAGTSTETTMGISVLAPYSVVGLGTASTSSGAPYVLENKDATTTPGTLCTGGTVKCIVAASLGKISQSFLDLTAAFTVTGLWTFNTGGFIDNASSTATGAFNLSNILTSTYSSTSTFAGNITVAKNASTTNLTISGTCAGCISGWATSTTQYQISLGSTNSNTVVATCAAGKKVIGGGYDVSGATAPGSLCSGNNVCVNQSYPDTSSSWTIRLTCPSGGSCSGYATSTAICVNQ